MLATGSSDEWRSQPVAVLASGGLDSAILVGELARTSPHVFPLYVHFGLMWEPAEETGLQRFLRALGSPVVQPLRTFDLPIDATYGEHWSTTGNDTPDEASADEAVFLPGRNMLLLAQTALWCHLRDIPAITLATLKGNPFPDASDAFFQEYERVFNRSVGGSLRIVRPYARLDKREVMRRGADLPLSETFSCIRPSEGLHCGRCNKCAERRRAFADAGLSDGTIYAQPPSVK